MQIGKKIFKTSRWIHKYPSLLLLVFLAYMSVSGILLNHRIVIRSLSVPKFLVPEHYHPNNWNRSSMKGMVYIDSTTYIAYGNQGVHISYDKGVSFQSFMQGDFPVPSWKKRTNHLIYDNKKHLFAATNNGVLVCNVNKGNWKYIQIPKDYEPVKKLLVQNNTLIAVAKSALHKINIADKNYSTTRHIPLKQKTEENIPMFRVFLQLHDGSIWGLPGKLLWDVAALFFLCLSAFYIWFYPKKWKRQYKLKKHPPATNEKNKRKFYLRHHKKLGWYAAILLAVIFFTGAFLRPPLLIAIARKSIAQKYYPALKPSNPWKGKINNALFDHQNNRIVLECKDGIWAGNLEDGQPFRKLDFPIRIFAMGATVFREQSPGTWLIGSFGGLNRFSLADSSSVSLLKTPKPRVRGMPGSLLVTGYVELPGGNQFVLGHYKGLCDTNGTPVNQETLKMPHYIMQNYKMPLWNFMFELHNARIFKTIFGSIYIIIIPLGGILSLLIVLSGVFDYWYAKLKNKKRSRMGKYKC